jgi:hypothetical protein
LSLELDEEFDDEFELELLEELLDEFELEFEEEFELEFDDEFEDELDDEFEEELLDEFEDPRPLSSSSSRCCQLRDSKRVWSLRFARVAVSAPNTCWKKRSTGSRWVSAAAGAAMAPVAIRAPIRPVLRSFMGRSFLWTQGLMPRCQADARRGAIFPGSRIFLTCPPVGPTPRAASPSAPLSRKAVP